VAAIDPSKPDGFPAILNDLMTRSLALDVAVAKLLTRPAA
jgi:hypothetical protein